MLMGGNAETEASRADIFLHGTHIPYGFPLLWRKKKNSRKLPRLERLGPCLIRYEIYYKSLAVRVMLAMNAFELMAPESYRKKYSKLARKK